MKAKRTAATSHKTPSAAPQMMKHSTPETGRSQREGRLSAYGAWPSFRFSSLEEILQLGLKVASPPNPGLYISYSQYLGFRV